MNSISPKPAASIESPLRLSPAALAEGLAECFQGYLVDIPFTPESVSTMIRTESIDLASSLVAFSDGRFVAIVLVSRRDRTSRIASMAIAPGFRRKGHGRRLLERVIEDARLRWDELLVLEAFEHNEPAIELYLAAGFQPTRKLLGFRGVLAASTSDELAFVPLAEVAEKVRRQGPGAASWPMSAATIEQLAAPLVGVNVGEAWAVVAPPSFSSAAVVVRSLALPQKGGSSLSRLLAAISAEFSACPVRMPPYFPEAAFRDAALEAGLVIDPISQLQLEMRL